MIYLQIQVLLSNIELGIIYKDVLIKINYSYLKVICCRGCYFDAH